MPVGNCPYFGYDGTGLVDLRIEGNSATLRIYPDVDRVSEGLRGTVEKPLTRLVSRQRLFQLRLAGWAEAKVQRVDGPTCVDQPGRAAQSAVIPGVYRLTQPATVPVR